MTPSAVRTSLRQWSRPSLLQYLLSRCPVTMASIPSASALSAVLRCQSNIWTSPSSRLTGSTARDLPVKTASLWEAFTHGERVVLGRLALTCNIPLKKSKANVCHGASQPAHAPSQGHAHTPGHAQEATSVRTRPALRAPRAKVVFVCDNKVLTVSSRAPDTTDRRLWVSVRAACGSVDSLVSHLASGRLLLLLRTGPDQEESGGLCETPGADSDSCPGEGSVGEARVMEDRPD